MDSTGGHVKWREPERERQLSYVLYMETEANSGLKVEELDGEQEVDRKWVDKENRG